MLDYKQMAIDTATKIKEKTEKDKLDRAESVAKLKLERQRKYEELWSSVKSLQGLVLLNNSLLVITEFNHSVSISENAYGVNKPLGVITLTEPELDIRLAAGMCPLIVSASVEDFMLKLVDLLGPKTKPE